jgi:hypothetical protein
VIELIETKEEKKEWVNIPTKMGLWKPETPGDTLIGKYIKKCPSSFMGRKNWEYLFESSHPEAVKGEISFYGTMGLNNALDDKLIGYDVKIVYEGEKKGLDPKKKPFKLFKVKGLFAPSDPLYKEYTEYDEKIKNDNDEVKPPASSDNSSSSLKTNDDPEAMNMVDFYKGELKRNNKEETADNVINLANNDEELTSEHLTRLKKHLADMVKAGEIKEK